MCFYPFFEQISCSREVTLTRQQVVIIIVICFWVTLRKFSFLSRNSSPWATYLHTKLNIALIKNNSLISYFSARLGFSLVNLGSLIRPLALGMASYFGLLSHSHRAYIFGYGCRTYFWKVPSWICSKNGGTYAEINSNFSIQIWFHPEFKQM